MLTTELYLQDPCRASSIPLWKAREITVPDHMKILHDARFDPGLLQHYTDEPYFRLLHDMQQLKPPILPQGFHFCQISAEELACHIRSCYHDLSITAEGLAAYTAHPVHDPDLWVAIRNDHTGEIVASGIAELDSEIGEGILEWIQVSEGYRGRGLGTAIVLELLRRMAGKAVFATVSGRCHNPTCPEGLYRACGFAGNDIWHILTKKP